ncbi:MAG TPA: VanZ family protein [Gemmatimonadaceae bacterium]|nr:VanZ family protein [Gemmatimonadaceae bacterium]
MDTFGALIFVGLGIIAMLGKRWAYIAFVSLSVLAIPARTGFRLHWPLCETVLTAQNIALSLTKYAHVVLFGIFFIMTVAQLRGTYASRFAWAALGTLVFGAVIELEQGATRTGNCRARDLFPDALGVVLGIAVVMLWTLVRGAGRRRSGALSPES